MQPRRDFFGGNWKMHKNLNQAVNFFTTASTLKWSEKPETVFFPPFHLLLPLKEYVDKKPFFLGAQNFYPADTGAFTGEVSAWMLREENIQYAIIGHSERRQYFHEDLELLAKKVRTGLDSGLTIIFCVGETLEQRESENHFTTVKTQLASALKHLTLPHTDKLVIAYEPVWAIGTGKTASPEQAQEMHAFIRQELENLGLPAAQLRIIYGGSVKPDNIQSLISQPDIDGGLVGGASLDAQNFYQIVHYK